MAKTETSDYSIRRGKMSKDSDVVYRYAYGKQQSYIPKPNTNPPSEAQTAHRKLFGKVATLVNAIMADPKQVAEWDEKLIAYHQAHPYDGTHPRYKTTRKFVFDTVKAQLTEQAAKRRKRTPLQKALPKGLRTHVKPFSELSTTELYELLKARFVVFYMEQHCYYQDMDDIDYNAIHIALHRKGRVIAYARLYADAESGVWHVGRMLTIERGRGFGKYILEKAEQEARRLGAAALVMHAQTHAVSFYEACGFTTYGDIFSEADIPHIAMRKAL